ncbi:hypothetical protein GMRT_24333 [Giardia muris]|uniref:Uncharacterized protein n=1 Tax=Giardia muris TaxID=5742 RepID=A0A4Z1SNI6_GIAMU|nr:hypothetical protein GMRT_24333 [Giardia muris]|eukprot:TNJ27316.1 hypothetical protein GMRT_24333 [Giardia muris]
MLPCLKSLLTMDMDSLPGDVDALKKLVGSFKEALGRLYMEKTALETKNRELIEVTHKSNESLRAAEAEIKSMRASLEELAKAQEASEDARLNEAAVLSGNPAAVGLMRESFDSHNGTPGSRGPTVGVAADAFGSLTDNSVFSRPPVLCTEDPVQIRFGPPNSGSFTGASLQMGTPQQGGPVHTNPFALPGSFSGYPMRGSMMGPGQSATATKTPDNFVSGSLTLKGRSSVLSTSISPSKRKVPLRKDADESESDDSPALRLKPVEAD